MNIFINRALKRPRKMPGRRWMARASVAVILRENKIHGREVLLIKRAERKGDPWSGDMAFPGGKMESADQSIYHTALREMNEEIGVDSRNLRQLGRLSDQLTKTHSGVRPMIISPFIFELSNKTDFVCNHEVSEIVWIPLAHFSSPLNRKQMIWKVKGIKIKLPCYWYRDKRVWGLTLRIIDELVAN